MQIIKIKKIKNKKEKENLSPYTLMYLNLKVRIGGLLIILVAHIYNEVIDILWHLTNTSLCAHAHARAQRLFYFLSKN